MKMTESVELMKQYADCPDCGSSHIGGGAGTLEITESTFTRSCNCGYRVIVTPTHIHETGKTHGSIQQRR